MSGLQQRNLAGMLGLRLIIGTFAGVLGLVPPALGDTDVPFHATFVEPVGGPVNSPFACDPGTSCGTANLSGFGHGSSIVHFGACLPFPNCSVRNITLDDGSQLVVLEYGDIAGFTSPGNSGQHGYNGFGFPGNPGFLDITQTIVGGTGRFADVVGGSAVGTVKIAGGAGIVTVTGTITLH